MKTTGGKGDEGGKEGGLEGAAANWILVPAFQPRFISTRKVFSLYRKEPRVTEA